MPEFRGAALAIQSTTEREWLISGPAETGKTVGCAWLLDTILRGTPNAQGVLLRKNRVAIKGTVLLTYQRVVARSRSGARPHGGKSPEWYDYPNGSRLWIAGLDDADKVLSSERDVIYVNQAEQLSGDDWQVLTTRVTGRGAVVRHPMLFGDCNPGPPTHWILKRPTLKLYESKHEDNPTLHDGTGWTEQGRTTLAVLDALTGVRKERLRYGRWRSMEGAVFEVDRANKLSPLEMAAAGWAASPAETGVRYRPGVAVRCLAAGVDWGYTAPGVMGVWAFDGDWRACLVREWYHTERLIGWWVERAKEAKALYGVTAFVCDPAEPAYIEAFTRAGLNAVAGDNDRSPGVQAVQARLAAAGDGRPRLFFAEDALEAADPALVAALQPTCTMQEADALAWAPDKNGRPAAEGAMVGPDHGFDACRYLMRWAAEMQAAGGGGQFGTGAGRTQSFRHLPGGAPPRKGGRFRPAG